MTLQTASFRARPSVMVATLSTLNSSPHAAIADPKAIDAVPPRDLTDTHKALDLEGYPGAVCVLVPPKVEIDADTALRMLTGSTMNGRYIDDGNKAGKSCDQDGVAKKRIGGLTIGHHHEPRRVAGKPCNRGEHVAVH